MENRRKKGIDFNSYAFEFSMLALTVLTAYVSMIILAIVLGGF